MAWLALLWWHRSPTLLTVTVRVLLRVLLALLLHLLLHVLHACLGFLAALLRNLTQLLEVLWAFRDTHVDPAE